MPSDPNFKFPELTGETRAEIMGDETPFAHDYAIQQDRAAGRLLQERPSNRGSTDPYLLRASLAQTTSGIQAAKEWGESLVKKDISPDGVEASSSTPRTIG